MRVMLGLLPLLGLFLCIMAARREGRGNAIVWGSLIWGVLIGGGTEVLGEMEQITSAAVLGFWIIVCIAAGFVAFANRRHKQAREDVWPAEQAGRLVIAAAISLLAVLLLIALIAPPQTCDAMTYHLARTTHWIQNRSLAHYATTIDRQLFMSPWQAIFQTQLILLSGGSDRWCNVPQWLALVGSSIGAWLIAAQLGISMKGRWLAAIAAGSAPMILAQSTSPQNDLVTAYWCVLAGVFATRPAGRVADAASAVGLGLACGLALMTKATAVLFLFPLGVVWALRVLMSGTSLGRRVLYPVMAVLLTVLPSAPHSVRNYRAFGSILQPARQKGLTTATRHDPAAIASLLLRHVASNYGTPLRGVNARIAGVVSAACRAVHVDPLDPSLSFLGDRFNLFRTSTQEDRAGNPVQMTLALAAGATVLVLGRRLHGLVLWYAAAVAAGFLIYCVLLKWQVWTPRLQTPFFVLVAPLSALAIERWLHGKFLWGVAVALLIIALPFVFYQQTRSVVAGPYNIFTRSRDVLRWPFEEAYPNLLAVAKNIHEQGPGGAVGVIEDDTANSREFLLSMALRERGLGSARLLTVYAGAQKQNPPLIPQQADKPPNFVVCLVEDAPASFDWHGWTFARSDAEGSGIVSLYKLVGW